MNAGRVLIYAFCFGLVGASSGCGASRQVLGVRALPVVVTPAEPDWGVSVGIDLRDKLYVRIDNPGSEPLSVLWEESSYIDAEQRSHMIVPESSVSVGRVAQRVIPPGAGLDEILVPVPGSASPPQDPFLSPQTRRRRWWGSGRKEKLRMGARLRADHPILGKQVGLFLVLERDGAKKTVLAKYVFSGA